MMLKTYPHNAQSPSERGNILFLILIAVALFAALSYAVTQSTRSGSDSGQKEQSMIGSAVLVQYPTALRSALMRMTTSGIHPSNILFDAPGSLSGASVYRMVFDSAGGGAVYQDAPADVMAVSTSANWKYNAEFRVPLVGSDSANGNDVVAFLLGVNESVCQKVNKDMRIGDSSSGQCTTYFANVPQVNLDNTKLQASMESGYSFPGNVSGDLIQCTGGTANAFTAKDRGCFYDPDLNGGQYVYYAVILER